MSATRGLLCAATRAMMSRYEASSWKEIIADAIGKRPESQIYQDWREETRQALRRHTEPSGRGYFSVAELGEGVVFTLTDQGQRMAARRSMDERAPTLSKYIAKAVAPDGG